MTLPAVLSHPLVRLALFAALSAIALGVADAAGYAFSPAACVVLIIGVEISAMRTISAPLDLALARTCDAPTPPVRMRDPVFHMIGITVLALAALWCCMFYLFGRATLAVAYLSFTLLR